MRLTTTLSLALLLCAARAGAIYQVSEPTYPVSAFTVEYALEQPRHIPETELLDLEVGLAGGPAVLTAPRPVDRTMRMRLSAPPQGVLFSASAIQHIAQSLVDTFNRAGYNGVIVTVPDIEEGSGRDLRAPGDTVLRLRIWTGRASRLATFADGERFSRLSAEERTDMPVHAWIRERAPVQPGGARAILDIRALQDFASALSRAPGRRVDVELQPGPRAGATDVNLRIAETKPWRVYAEYSNTGTSSTTKNRERFGFVDNQLTSRDDILDLRYTTGDFDSVHSVVGSYEAPFTLSQPQFRGRVSGFWSTFDASEVAFDDLGFQGDEWATEGSLVWQAFQHRELFVDLVGGFRYHDIHSEGGQFNQGAQACRASGEGEAAFAVPHLGVESERSTAWTSARAVIGLDVGVTNADSCNLDNLGNENADSEFTLISWSALYNFFLEPLIDPAGWEDPENPQDSTLAHEIALTFSGQFSPNRLVPQYQTVLGGFDTVRGAKQAEMAGDNMFFGRAEYRLHVPRLFTPDATPPEVPVLGRFRTRPTQVFGMPDWDFIVRVFTDAGYIYQSDQIDSDAKGTLWSAGTGVELQVLRNLVLGVDVGHVLYGPESSDKGDTRANVLATLLY